MLITFTDLTGPLYIIAKRINLYSASFPGTADEMVSRGRIQIDDEIALVEECAQRLAAEPNQNRNHYATVPHTIYKMHRELNFGRAWAGRSGAPPPPPTMDVIEATVTDLRHLQILAGLPPDSEMGELDELVKLKCVQAVAGLYVNLLDYALRATGASRALGAEAVALRLSRDGPACDDSLDRIYAAVEEVDRPGLEEGLWVNEVATLLVSVTGAIEAIRERAEATAAAVLPSGLLEQSKRLHEVAFALYCVMDPTHADFPGWA